MNSATSPSLQLINCLNRISSTFWKSSGLNRQKTTRRKAGLRSKLERLADQHSRGIISEEDFKAKKKQILGVPVSGRCFGPRVRKKAEARRTSIFLFRVFFCTERARDRLPVDAQNKPRSSSSVI
jgi:hypothetical protein